MDSAEVTRIEQEALLWVPPGRLFDSVLLPVLSRLEQPDNHDAQELIRHWFSDRLRTRLHNMLEGQQIRPSTAGSPQVAVDQFDGPRPLTAAEFHLLLQLGALTQVRLSPGTLNQSQAATLMGIWQPDGWVRLVLPHLAGADTISAILMGKQGCPDTMVIPCAPHNGTDAEDDNAANAGGSLLRGTADQCYRQIFERLRRR